MTLRHFINGFDLRALRPTPLPKTSAIARSATKISADREFIYEPVKFDLGPLAAKLRQVACNEEWDQLDGREIRIAPHCWWIEKPPLIEDHKLIRAYLDVLGRSPTRGAVKNLIWVYLVKFDFQAEAMIDISRWLSKEVTRWDWEWGTRHKRFQLFDKIGPACIAAAALSSTAPQQVLNDAGLSGILSSSAFAAACFRKGAELVQQRLQKLADTVIVDNFVRWSKGMHGRFGLHSTKDAYADALLAPWRNADPPDELKGKIRTAILEQLGDPRTARAEWASVPEPSRQVLLRWLARASLEQFLAVVDRTALGHQWEYRRAFWSAYLDKGHVKDAWVVFGTTGRAKANQLAKNSDDPGMRSFGNLRGGLADHAVLLLTIGDLIIADWSHNGTLRIWKSRSEHAPQQYRDQYQATDLRREPDFDQRHLGDWQRATRDFIRSRTGINISEFEYLPRGKRR